MIRAAYKHLAIQHLRIGQPTGAVVLIRLTQCNVIIHADMISPGRAKRRELTRDGPTRTIWR